MKTKLSALLLTLSFVLGISGCSPSTSTEALKPVQNILFPPSIDAEDYDAINKVKADNQVDDVFKEAVKAFSLSSASLLLDTNKNYIYSPLSIYFALALTAQGTDSQTADEFLSVLGVSSLDELAESCAKLYRFLYTDNDITQLKIANSLWAGKSSQGKDINYDPDYFVNTAKQFYAESFLVDFSDKKLPNQMSDWIKENTKGVLTPEIQIIPDQFFSIINTLYYNNQWQDAFRSENTKDDLFYPKEADPVTVPFLSTTFDASSFTRGEDYLRSRLNFKNNASVIFVLPNEDVDISSLVSSADSLKKILYEGEDLQGEVEWKVPKLSYGQDTEINDIIQQMGIKTAWDSAKADFSKLTDLPDISISQILHGAHIDLNENGVEAAAYTKVDMGKQAAPLVENNEAKMILNRPFLYAIEQDGMILFMGVVHDPSAKN